MDLNRLVAYLLRVGVLVGAFLSLLGLAIWASQGFTTSDSLGSYDILSILRLAFTGSAAGIADLGIIILVATPILRVTVSTVYFGKEKDVKFVLITVIVLAMLIFALFSGRIA